MFFWIFVELDVAFLSCEDCVVSPDVAVLPWKPFRASLSEDDVAWYHILLTRSLGPETSARSRFRAICAAFCGVMGGSEECEGWEKIGGSLGIVGGMEDR